MSVRALLLAGGLLLVTSCFRAPPPDAQLRSHFVEHIGVFSELREMITVDRLFEVGECGQAFARQMLQFQDPESFGVGPERVKLYARLLRQIGCPGVNRLEDNTVIFHVDGQGMASHGWRAGVLWSTKEPENLIVNLDAFQKTKAEWEYFHSRVEGNWYLRLVW